MWDERPFVRLIMDRHCLFRPWVTAVAVCSQPLRRPSPYSIESAIPFAAFGRLHAALRPLPTDRGGRRFISSIQLASYLTLNLCWRSNDKVSFGWRNRAAMFNCARAAQLALRGPSRRTVARRQAGTPSSSRQLLPCQHDVRGIGGPRRLDTKARPQAKGGQCGTAQNRGAGRAPTLAAFDRMYANRDGAVSRAEFAPFTPIASRKWRGDHKGRPAGRTRMCKASHGVIGAWRTLSPADGTPDAG